jgi:acetyl-CoA C-acetyltransferase
MTAPAPSCWRAPRRRRPPAPTPLFRVLGYAVAGVRPEVMGIGPVPAVRRLLERTGLKVGDFDVIESNEAFAAQALAVNKELGLDPAKVNPNGGAIASGPSGRRDRRHRHRQGDV